MLEPDPVERIGELDVDAEVVRVELELVARADARVFGDVHGQRRDLAGEGQPPVSIPGGRRIENNALPLRPGLCRLRRRHSGLFFGRKVHYKDISMDKCFIVTAIDTQAGARPDYATSNGASTNILSLASDSATVCPEVSMV